MRAKPGPGRRKATSNRPANFAASEIRITSPLAGMVQAVAAALVAHEDLGDARLVAEQPRPPGRPASASPSATKTWENW